MQQMKRMYDKDGNSLNHLSLWTNEWKMKSKLTSIPWSVIWSEKQIEVISEWSFSFQEKKKERPYDDEKKMNLHSNIPKNDSIP